MASIPLTAMVIGANAAVPFDLVTAGNADLAYNPVSYVYTAPASGLYAFSWLVAISAVGVAANTLITTTLQVNGIGIDGVNQTLPVSAAAQIATLSGSTVTQLAAGQKVTVVAQNTTLAGQVVNIVSPVGAGVKPFYTRFSGRSLF